MTETNRLLIAVTNVAEYKKVGYRTGLWLAELTHFWDVADEARLSSTSSARVAATSRSTPRA